MCGIMGFSFKSGKLSSARKAILAANLAYQNDQRGGHSWGVVGLNGGKAFINRGMGDLMDNAHALCDYDTLFAHTRWASCGEKTIENAHPFRIGNILGAHNGKIYNHLELDKKYGRKFPVDSQHIFAHLNENRSFDDMEGYGAIEWIRRNDPNTIYLSKLLDGELAIYGIGDINNTDGIVWSSNFQHALKSLAAAGITEFFRYEVRKGTVFMINDGDIHIQTGIKLELSKYEPPPVPEIEWPYHKVDDFRTFRKMYMDFENKKNESLIKQSQLS